MNEVQGFPLHRTLQNFERLETFSQIESRSKAKIFRDTP